MPINTQHYIPIQLNSMRSFASNQTNNFSELVQFYKIMTGHKYPFQTDPVQLHFEFYNERHHKPKKKKLKVEHLCPF